MVRFSGVVRVRGRNLCLDIPDAARNELLPFVDRGRIRVAGRLKGAEFNATLMPVKEAGHVLYLSGGLRAATGLSAGDSVVVDVKPEPAGQVTPPGDIALALHNEAGATERWRRLPAAERRELVRFVEDARTQATRARRIEQVVAQVLGRRIVSPGQRMAGPLWTCPTCGQAFVTRNMNHSCGRHSVEEPFQGKPPEIRRLFDLVRQSVEAIGPVALVPYRDRVAFMVKVRFAGAKPANTWLDVEFWLTRRIETPRLRKVESLTPYTHIHTVRLTGPADVDDELAGWLREAYEVGCQHHLRER